MRLSVATNNNETKNVQSNAQVNNPTSEPVMHEVDVIGMMTALKRDGHVKLSDHATPVTVGPAPAVPQNPIEDAVAEEIPVNAEVPEAVGEIVDAPAKPEVKLKRKVQLKKKVTQKAQKAAPATKAAAPAAYSVVTFPAKKGGNSSKLYGFKSEDDAKKLAERISKSAKVTWDYGPDGKGRETKTRYYYIWLGTRYEQVAAELCAALNAGNKTAISDICGKAQDVYAMAVAAGKAEREAKKQEREAAKDAEEPAAAAKTYTAEEVAAMLEAVCNGGMVPENVRKHIKQAA